ncbi:hypothetical protein IAR50_004387 [Cryptococcus sp. DSM 104548]
MLQYLRLFFVALHVLLLIFLIVFSVVATGSAPNLIIHIVSCFVFLIYIPVAIILPFARRNTGKWTFCDMAWGELVYLVMQLIIALLSMIFSVIKYVHYPTYHWADAPTFRKTSLIAVAVVSAFHCVVLIAWMVVVVLIVKRAQKNKTGDWNKGISWMVQDEREKEELGDRQELRTKAVVDYV